MLRIIVLCTSLLAWLFLTPAHAQERPERRVAMVIGNSAYEHTSPLRNPANDAGDIAESLRKLGFDVVQGNNLSVEATDKLRTEFQTRMAGADVALLFYAGHGLQFANRNYMVPIDARLANDFAVRRETTSIDEIIDDMQRAAKLSIVFLDACRNNPLADKLAAKSGSAARGDPPTRGLARMDPSRDSNSLIVFATAPGSVAEDGIGRNSPFTEALLRHIDEPADIEVMLKRVDRDVNLATKGRQQPERLSKLKTEFQFAAKQPSGAVKPLVRPPVQVTQAEADYWQQVKVSTDPAVVRAYLDRYPGGLYSNLARERLRELEKGAPAKATPKVAAIDPEIECSETLAVGTREAQKRYLDLFPTHRCSDQIRKIIRMESDQTMWERVVKSERVADFKKYLEAFPDGVYTAPAKDRIAMLEATEKGKSEPPSETTRGPIRPPSRPPADFTPAPTARSNDSSEIATLINTHISGNDLRIEKNTDQSSCARACRNESDCVAYAYDKWNRWCFLKDSTNVASLDPKYFSGFKVSEGRPNRSSTSVTIVRYNGKKFPGSGSYQPNAGSTDACADQCEASGSCVAYTHNNSNDQCRHYESAGEYTSDSDSDSGVKRQVER
jgi:Caspase domain/PAN domain